MDHRERVIAALNHEEPDRVPMALWGSAYGVVDTLYFQLLKYLGFSTPVPPFRPNLGHTVNYLDDRILEYLDIDVRYVWLGSTDLISPKGGNGVDAFGVRWKKTAQMMYPIEHPLARASIEDVHKYALPEIKNLIRLDELKERAKRLRYHTDYAIIARSPLSYGLYEEAAQLRGVEQFLMDLLLNEELVFILVGKLTDFYYNIIEIYLDAIAQYVDIFELPGDDYAGTTGPIFSPKLFEKFFRPSWEKIIHLIKEANPEIRILFHSDGDITPFLKLFIEMGVDVHHPLEPVPSLDLGYVKKEYGGQLTILGGIDIKKLSHTSIEEVKREVEEKIESLAPGGGYILAPSNHVQEDVSPENLVAVYMHAREYGKYS